MEVEHSHSMSTPSSEDAYPENVQISSDSGDYEMPPVAAQKPRLRQHKTVSMVTADTRKILEQFVKRGVLPTSLSDFNSHLEHQYAVVGDLFDEDPQPTPYQQIGSDDDCFSDFFPSSSKADALRLNTEPDYVDCQMLVKELINAEVHRKNLLHRSHRKVNSPPGNVKFAVVGGTKGKNKTKVKLERDKEDDASSSSTEDYEFPDTELLNRKKKSSFRLALERVRQSFRRQGKKPSEVSQDSTGRSGKVTCALSREQPKEYLGKNEVPLPPTPVSWRPHSTLHRESSEASKTQATASGTPSEIDFGHGGKPSAAPDPHVHNTLPLDDKKKKSPALWRKSEAKEKGNEEKVRENRGIFEVILRQFRKGNSKQKRKGGSQVVKQRFHSADNLALHPLNEDEKKLVEHFARLNRRDVEYDSDFAHNRVDRPTFLPPLDHQCSDLASRQGHHSFRQKMHLDGLVACRPHMPVPLKELERDEPQTMFLAVPVSSSESGSISVAVDLDPVDDCIDFGLAEIEKLLTCSTSKPFSQKSEKEKDDLFEKIAEQLTIIADHYNLDSPSSPLLLYAASQNKESEEKIPENPGSIVSETRKEEPPTLDSLVPHQMSQLNCVQHASDFSNSPAVAQLVKTPTYGTFKQIVGDSVGAETGWQQIAKLFRLTQSAVHLAGMGTSVAGVIMDMTIRYFEDRFASWIVGQGGWESMVEDTNTELDSELD